MRALVLAALLVSAPAFAQGATPDSTSSPSVPPLGAYVEGGAGFGWSSVEGLLFVGHAALGYQLPNGFDAGVRTFGVTRGTSRGSLSIQPEVGYTRFLNESTTLSARLGVRGTMTGGPIYTDPALSLRSVAAVGHATVSQRLDLGRGLKLVPVVGVYGGAGRTFDALYTSGGQTFDAGGSPLEAGVLAGLQLEFDALGAHFQVGPVLSFPVHRNADRALGDFGYRPVLPTLRVTF